MTEPTGSDGEVQDRARSVVRALLGATGLEEVLDRIVEAARPVGVLTGWATVELDRAGRELGRDVRRSRGGRHGDAPDGRDASDETLGAIARILDRPGDPPAVVLLEPNTEGLLAAALARHGEGPVAAYLRIDIGGLDRARGAGFNLTSERRGPVGPQRLVLTGPRSGPFVLLVPDPERPSALTR